MSEIVLLGLKFKKKEKKNKGSSNSWMAIIFTAFMSICPLDSFRLIKSMGGFHFNCFHAHLPIKFIYVEFDVIIILKSDVVVFCYSILKVSVCQIVCHIRKFCQHYFQKAFQGIDHLKMRPVEIFVQF